MYNNFELYNPFISIEMIVWALFAGFVIASLMAVYNKRVIGGFVKAVLEAECLSPESAKTVTELGYGTDWFIKNALRTDTVLRRFVVRIDADKDSKETEEETPDSKPQPKRRKHDVIDYATARFYIPEELKYRAEVRYARHGTDLVSFGICVIILAVTAFAAIFLIPDILTLIDNFIGTL